MSDKLRELRAELKAVGEELNTIRLQWLETVSTKLNPLITDIVHEQDRITTLLMETPGKEPLFTNRKDRVECTPHGVALTAPSGRRCGNCQQIGHDIRNCTQERVEKPAVVKEKKQRKPMSDERKAQLRETLKKARAARGKGTKK